MQKPIARSGSAWWPHGRVAQNTLSACAGVDAVMAGAGRADAAHHRIPRPGRHHRVAAVERDAAAGGGDVGDVVDEVLVVHQHRLHAGAHRRFAPLQVLERRRFQYFQHRLQARRRLRVARARLMLEAGRVGINECAHGWFPSCAHDPLRRPGRRGNR
jgi:hypothetical protein